MKIFIFFLGMILGLPFLSYGQEALSGSERRYFNCINRVFAPGVSSLVQPTGLSGANLQENYEACVNISTTSYLAVFTEVSDTQFTWQCVAAIIPFGFNPIDACDRPCPDENDQFCGSQNGDYASLYVHAIPMGSALFEGCNDLSAVSTVSALEACRDELAEMVDGFDEDLSLNFAVGTFTFQTIAFLPNPCIDPATCWMNPTPELPSSTCAFDDTNGHRTCTCPEGYENDTTSVDGSTYIPGTRCIDVNECDTTTDPCAHGSTCMNNEGSYVCICDFGFVLVGAESSTSDCQPYYDECLLPIEPLCDSNAVCTPFDGGHNCTCKDGYDGDGFTCLDVDECSLVAVCGAGATCQNTEGSFICVCDSGYIELTDGSCEEPSAITPCSGAEPTDLDRQVAWGADCQVAVLLACDDSSGVYDGERLVITGMTNAECDNNELVSTFERSDLNDRDAFMNGGGESLLNHDVQCTNDGFSINIDRVVANLTGFNLGNLFLGGEGTYADVAANYGNDPNCKGKPWYENGIQLRFEIDGDSTDCGTTHEQSVTEITYSSAIRGETDFGSNSVISRALDFYVGFTCIYSRATDTSTTEYFVYDARRKRNTATSSVVTLPNQEVTMELGLWRDSAFSVSYEQSDRLNAGDLVYASLDLLDFTGRYGVQLLRCWLTPTIDGRGAVYKNIISNGCEESELNRPENMYQRILDSSVRLGFPVHSFQGGNEEIYLSCMVDVLDKASYAGFSERCNRIMHSQSSILADLYMSVITVGPISTNDVCGGTNKGGCDHYCAVTSQQTPRCYCFTGFEVDPENPKRCQLVRPVNAGSGTVIYWYYYVIPIILLLCFIVLISFAIHKIKRDKKETSGKYMITEPGSSGTL